MSLKTVSPYLNFNGTAAAAIDHYVGAIGATVVSMQRFGDVPGMQCTEDEAKQIMHAALSVGEAQVMLSDTMPGQPVQPGTNTWVALQYADTSVVDAHFARLADGGEVVMPMNDTFWGARFGMLVDRFGIRWMLNAERKG